jgi:hypothetical protein
MNRFAQPDSVVIGGNGLHVNHGGDRAAGYTGWVHGRDAAIQGKPDPAVGILDDGLEPLYALHAAQAIGQPVLAKVTGSQRAAHQLVALHAQHVT